MTDPRAKPPLALLLTAAKRKKDVNWLTIERDLDLRRSTREAWMNGSTRRLPLVELMELCEYLSVKPSECVAAVMEHELPKWVVEFYVTEDGAMPKVQPKPRETRTSNKQQPRR